LRDQRSPSPPEPPRPTFSVADSNGKTVKLSDYKGKFVVLEWTNPECPFVRAQYGADAMQALQKDASGKDVVWLTVNSTNKSSSEYKTGAQMNAWMKERNAAQKAILIDAASDAGRAYDAKTTPHMFVIDPAGKIVYAGAIDDKRSARESDRKTGEQLRARGAQRNARRQAGDRREHHAVRLLGQVLSLPLDLSGRCRCRAARAAAGGRARVHHHQPRHAVAAQPRNRAATRSGCAQRGLRPGDDRDRRGTAESRARTRRDRAPRA
jgi:peroxiredoxin